MKVLKNISFTILVLSLVCLGVWHFADVLPDWTVRIAGVTCGASLAVNIFSSVRMKKEALQASK